MSTEIDPQLPYIQVHRGVAAMAAQLAPLLGVTYQHVRGSLDVFWENLADRRILARALVLTTPMVLLDDKECRRRLHLAFGMEVLPELAATVGVLELQPDAKWRVKGMSRYLETERTRLVKKKGAAPAPPESHPGATPVPPPVPPPIAPPVGPHRGERREARGETKDLKGEDDTPPPAKFPPVPPEPPDRFASGEAYWAHVQNRRRELGHVTEKYPKNNLSTWWSEVGMELNGRYELLDAALARFGANKHWSTTDPPWPFDAFIKTWRDYVRPASAV